MGKLRIGGVIVARGEAVDHARRYLTDGTGWAYPAYDGYERDRADGPVTDADLLAPVLLNVSHLTIRTFEALQAKRAEFDEHLARIPLDLDLADAGPNDLAVLGDLFAVQDGSRVWGVQGTVLAKVLHRKRPRFVPLYDERVRAVYQDGPDAPVPPPPRRTRRSWREFVVLYAEAIQQDLHREADLWLEIAALAPGPPITPLRALDIVAWWAGHPGRARPASS